MLAPVEDGHAPVAEGDGAILDADVRPAGLEARVVQLVGVFGGEDADLGGAVGELQDAGRDLAQRRRQLAGLAGGAPLGLQTGRLLLQHAGRAALEVEDQAEIAVSVRGEDLPGRFEKGLVGAVHFNHALRQRSNDHSAAIRRIALT